MIDYSNWKVIKSVLDYAGEDEVKKKAAQQAQIEYGNVANWCDKNQQYVMSSDELYYNVVKKELPSIEYMKEQVRYNRDVLLNQTDFTQLSDAPFTSDEKKKYKDYRKYLRDYTDKEEWWLDNPLTFEDWQKTIDF